ncbi:PREDICTED: uncharacterized protein LOC107094370 isoform X1 [Cyprinodon variegatus]|uniref:uncharacterized protein LOC107094370 isoform X1 n=1 Tax=Cyprinodon variegatus TaxID=28743 RepID=UPI0007426F4A|nr:PREDICTED: uncharacterized protein LOC107094370 isoform X1 [Cyprinodon variegatus]
MSDPAAVSVVPFSSLSFCMQTVVMWWFLFLRIRSLKKQDLIIQSLKDPILKEEERAEERTRERGKEKTRETMEKEEAKDKARGALKEEEAEEERTEIKHADRL